MAIEFAYLSAWSFLNGQKGLDGYKKIAQKVEASGFSAMGVPDTQYLKADCYIGVTLAASVTQRILIGPCPSNPITREPSVTAASLAGIDAMSEGRAILVLATGNTSAYAVGRRPATRAHLERYIQTVRDLILTGDAKYVGRKNRVKWTNYTLRKKIPIYIIAEGPKMLWLAGKIADGVIVGNGLIPEVVERSLEIIERGAAASGRTMSEIDLWWLALPGLGKTMREAIDSMKPSITGVGYHCFSHDLNEKQVPKHLRSAITKYIKEHDFISYGDAKGRNVHLMDQLGLTDYFLERLAIVGTAGDWINKINGLKKTGIQKIWLSPFQGGQEPELHNIDTFSNEILPAVLNDRTN